MAAGSGSVSRVVCVWSLSLAWTFAVACSSGQSGGTDTPAAGQATAAESSTVSATPVPTPTIDPGRVVSCTEEAFAVAFEKNARITFGCSGTITLTATRTVYGGEAKHISGAGQNVTLSGGGVKQLFSVLKRGSLQLDNLTISGGSAERGGAVLVAEEGQFDAEAVVFEDNVAAFAGGAIHTSGTVRLRGATFQRNQARAGGGAIFAFSGELEVARTTFNQNEAVGQPGGSGGAIGVGFGSAAIRESTFSGNSAKGAGGAVDVLLGTATIGNSTFFGNVAIHGGAIASYGVVTVINSTISGNSSSTYGGISNGRHGGIGDDDPRTLTLRNTIISDNTIRDCGSFTRFTDGGGNLVKDRLASCSIALGGDPGLAPLQDNGGPTSTMGIGPESPAFDAGVRATCDAPFPDGAGGVDQRGAPRTTCSAGAFEPGALGRRSALRDTG